MHKNDIENYILETFDDVHPLDSWGEKSFFLNPGLRLNRGTYFATLKEKDGENDKASYLNRDGIFRLNMGVSKEFYLSLFQNLPKRPAKGCFIEGDYDFQRVDAILPHPVYGWMGWICVLNPSVETFEECKNLLADAYRKAMKATLKKLSKLRHDSID
jgi:hypothetical protein